jgi:rhomboid protease GluP
MDFTSIVVIQIAIFSCVMTLLPTSRSNSSIKIGAIAVLTILAMSWQLVPQQAAKIGTIAWIGLLLLPMMLMYRLESLVTSTKYLAASHLARWLRWLLPTDGMWNYHHLLRGIALAQTGQIQAADDIFAQYQTDDRTEIGRAATALLYRSTDRWHEYITWVKQRLTLLPLQRLHQREMTLVYYVRALAETGNLPDCMLELTTLERNRQINLQQSNLLRMYILAYCGRIDPVTQLFRGLLSMYPAAIGEFWIATAELAAGKSEVARTQLANIREQTTDSCIQQDIIWRLSKPLPDLTALTPTDWEIVTQIEAIAKQEMKYGSQIPRDASTPATNLLIWINVLIFGAELGWQYQTGNREASFIPWGGLVAPLVLAGEWWRLVTANFLHLGGLHLGMNMFALLYLGKFVEYRLGTLRFTIAYLLAGIGSMAVITYVDTRWLTQPQITVGASGAIMGLLGAMGAIHLVNWRQGKVTSAARQFKVVLFSVGFQLVFDLTNGHTSIVGHFSGLTIGFLGGLILLLFGTRL